MLANKVISVPSKVTARVFLILPSFLRARSRCACRSRYCLSITVAGSTITTPASPSMMIQSSCLITREALFIPTAAGMSRLRATIAVCEFWPPRSVTKPAKARSRNCNMSAGEMSYATTTIFPKEAPSPSTSGNRVEVPVSTFNRRSPTCSTSILRSRR